MKSYPTIPLDQYQEFPLAEMRERVAAFYENLDRRRTVREFSDRPVPRDIIETALKAGNTAPSGANLQPWHFVVISGAETKKKKDTTKSTKTAKTRRVPSCSSW